MIRSAKVLIIAFLMAASWAVLISLILGGIWLVDRLQGTGWPSLLFVVALVGLVFSLDRLHAAKARRQMRRRYHTVSDSSGKVIAFFPRHRDAA